MLLQQLKEYSDRPGFESLPRLYSLGALRYIIELDSEGHLSSPMPTDVSEPGRGKARVPQWRPPPHVQHTFGVKAMLLAQNAAYALGYAGQGGKPDRVAACHQAFSRPH
jgi:CRISPR-associated protein Csd1